MAGPRPDDAAVATWASFIRANADVTRAIERDLRSERDLSLGWYDVLLELNYAPARRLRMDELGRRAVLSRSRVSRIVDELVDHGLAGREPDPSDRRATFAVLTSAGRQAFRRAAPVYLRAIQRHFAGRLTATQLATIRAACQRLLATDASSGT